MAQSVLPPRYRRNCTGLGDSLRTAARAVTTAAQAEVKKRRRSITLGTYHRRCEWIPTGPPTVLFDDSQKLIHAERQHAEHEMRHHLLRSAHPNVPTAKFIFQSCVNPFYHR